MFKTEALVRQLTDNDDDTNDTNNDDDNVLFLGFVFINQRNNRGIWFT